MRMRSGGDKGHKRVVARLLFVPERLADALFEALLVRPGLCADLHARGPLLARKELRGERGAAHVQLPCVEKGQLLAMGLGLGLLGLRLALGLGLGLGGLRRP